MQYPPISLPWFLVSRRASRDEDPQPFLPAAPTIDTVFFLFSLLLAGAGARGPVELPPAVVAVWWLAAEQGAVWGAA